METDTPRLTDEDTSPAGPPYRTPPIIEAIIEFRFVDPLNDRTFARLSNRIAKKYDDLKNEQLVQVHVDLAHSAPSFRNVKPVHRLSSSDQTDICVLRDDTISWSRLPPYEGWEPFCTRVARDLETAFKVTGTRKINRLGVRYLNRIDVPYNDDNGAFCYEDYFTIKLNLPPMLDTINAYYWMVEREFPDVQLHARVNSGSMQPEVPNTAAFLLDIDIGAMVDVPSSHDDIIAKLGTMRKLKNDIFEVAITPTARGSFS